MDWVQVSIDTTHEGAELLCAELLDIGISGFEIEDSADFGEFLVSEFPYRDYVDEDLIKEKENAEVRVKVYIKGDDDGAEELLRVKEKLAALSGDPVFGSLSLELTSMQEQDWTENWKQFFHPQKIGEKILICPEWEECEAGGRVKFTINPGMSFGTGSHGTTQLCLEAIEKFVKPGERLLDLGCGSGILSIVAILLGAECATAVDIDENAVEVARKNAEKNGVFADKYELFAGNIMADEALCEKLAEKPYDVVAANIVADVIIGISDTVPRFLKKDGIFIASGIIIERKDEVLAAIEKSFKVIEVYEKSGWAAIVSVPK